MDLILNTNTISFTIELCDIHYVGIYEKKKLNSKTIVIINILNIITIINNNYV